MIENQKNKPVLLIALTIIMVIILSHFLNGVTILGYTVKPIDLFMDIKPDSLLSYNYNSIDKNFNFVDTTNSGKSKFSNSVFSASVSFDLIREAFEAPHNTDKDNVSETSEAGGPAFTNVQLTGNLDQMKYFFNALKESRSQQIRVAHYGDSGVEGDNVTANIREDLQREFGGYGVGFLSITSQDITFRTTTRMSFSDNWQTISVLTNNPQNLPLGISGFVAIPQSNSWVRYATKFSTAKIFYSNAKSSSIKYSFNDGSDQFANLKPGNDLKELTLSAPGGNGSSFKLTATMSNQGYFYGVSLESGNGVYVDNFPWRGNTGLGFLSISESSFQQFSKMMNYKLIILSFGANETSFGSGDNKWYANQMVKVINNLKRAFPQTSILLIGVGDRGIKRGTRFVTDPNIPLLLKVQQDIVARTGVAFWNLFEAMGGYNSMETWVQSNYALLDYTHPSQQGAAKIGDMIAKALIDAYNKSK
ncbi:MAG: GDSL-type esterase/lipase family protein [Bacteroidetes bacterium]|nr:GDSL-type esterase/lipase family protein [Bacteroidota bacterium]